MADDVPRTWAHSLFILISLFVLTGLLLLTRELRSEPTLYHEGVEASSPHGPAEFPEVFAYDPLEGLGPDTGEIQVASPPLDEDYWPCSECHDDPESDNPEKRPLKYEHKSIVLDHGDEERWCLDCHDFEDRDSLRLASGKKVSFTESYKLCGQCHGTIYRDWRAGIHGRRTGYWDGAKRYLLCVHCHWPHAPRFKPLEPLPPPVRPEYLRPEAREEEE